MDKSNYACFYIDDIADLDSIAENSFQYSSQVLLIRPHAVLVEFGRSSNVISHADFLNSASAFLSRVCGSFRIAEDRNPLCAFIKAKFAVNEFLDAPIRAIEDIVDPEQKSIDTLKQTYKLVCTLSKLQIRTLREFKELPRAHFSSRFGRVGLLLKARVDGELLPSFEKAVGTIVIKASEELASSYNGVLGSLVEVIERLLSVDIFPQLRKLGAKLEELKIDFLFERNSIHPAERRSFHVRFVEPQYLAEDTISIIWTTLETSLQRNPIHHSTPVLSIEVEAEKWVLDLDEQIDSIDKSRLQIQKENLLLTRQKQRYGDENIFRAQLTADRRPEKSWIKVTDPKMPIINPDIVGRTPVRPVFRLPAPYPIHIAKDRSTIRRGKRIEDVVEWEAMSEVLACHWFENDGGQPLNTYNRIYSRVHLKNGRELSVFEDAQGRFFLDGFSG